MAKKVLVKKVAKEVPFYSTIRKRSGPPPRFGGPVGSGRLRLFLGRYMRSLDAWPLGAASGPHKPIETVGYLDAAGVEQLQADARRLLRRLPKGYVPGKKGQTSIR